MALAEILLLLYFEYYRVGDDDFMSGDEVDVIAV